MIFIPYSFLLSRSRTAYMEVLLWLQFMSWNACKSWLPEVGKPARFLHRISQVFQTPQSNGSSSICYSIFFVACFTFVYSMILKPRIKSTTGQNIHIRSLSSEMEGTLELDTWSTPRPPSTLPFYFSNFFMITILGIPISRDLYKDHLFNSQRLSKPHLSIWFLQDNGNIGHPYGFLQWRVTSDLCLIRTRETTPWCSYDWWKTSRKLHRTDDNRSDLPKRLNCRGWGNSGVRVDIYPWKCTYVLRYLYINTSNPDDALLSY